MARSNPFGRRRRTTGMEAARLDAGDTLAAVPPTNEDLLTRVARGDREAFSELYDRCMPLVFGITRRVVRDPSQAEEVAQEAMVQIWRTAGRFDPERGSARAYVSTIAHRRAVDCVRSVAASRRREEVDSTAKDVAPTEEAAPDVAVVESFERRQVREALDRLTDTQREAIVLAFYEGRTHTEVAALLDVPLGTVKTRIRDGLVRLRDSMGVTT